MAYNKHPDLLSSCRQVPFPFELANRDFYWSKDGVHRLVTIHMPSVTREVRINITRNYDLQHEKTVRPTHRYTTCKRRSYMTARISRLIWVFTVGIWHNDLIYTVYGCCGDTVYQHLHIISLLPILLVSATDEYAHLVHEFNQGYACSLRKHAFSNILRILPPKYEN